MVAVITDNANTASLCQKACESLGLLHILLSPAQNPRKAQIELISAAIVSVDSDREKASSLCRAVKRIKPNIQILTLVVPTEESSARYLDVAGSTCQLYLPCSEHELANKLKKLCRTEFELCDLYFAPGKRQIIYRGYPLKLSKQEYTVLRSLAISSPNPIKDNRLCVLCGNISVKCLAVHVCNINRKADMICACRLISYQCNGYILNRHE